MKAETKCVRKIEENVAARSMSASEEQGENEDGNEDDESSVGEEVSGNVLQTCWQRVFSKLSVADEFENKMPSRNNAQTNNTWTKLKNFVESKSDKTFDSAEFYGESYREKFGDINKRSKVEVLHPWRKVKVELNVLWKFWKQTQQPKTEKSKK